jgi:hypothetical protein
MTAMSLFREMVIRKVSSLCGKSLAYLYSVGLSMVLLLINGLAQIPMERI